MLKSAILKSYSGKNKNAFLLSPNAPYYDSELGIWMNTNVLAEQIRRRSVKHYTNSGALSFDVTEKQEWPPKWWKELNNWFNGSSTYDGSGWGHGLREQIFKSLGLDNKGSNLIEVGIKSMLQAGEITLEGNSLEKIANDPVMISYETELISQAKADPKFHREAYAFLREKPVQFGGKRASEDMFEQIKDPFNPKYKDTWRVAANELTWLVRSTIIKSIISVNKSGYMTIEHKFSDIFDLRPSDYRTGAYNMATKILGFLYHDIAGGNDQMRVKATWKRNYQLAK